MHRLALLAAGAALLLAPAAYAQQGPATPPAASPAPAAAPTIKSVTVIDIQQLPAATQTQVDTMLKQTSEADLAALRTSLDASPQIKSALEAQGATSSQVIAASMAQDGALTLVTRKKS